MHIVHKAENALEDNKTAICEGRQRLQALVAVGEGLVPLPPDKLYRDEA